VGLAAITDIINYSQGDNSCQSVTPAFMGGTYENRSDDYHAANAAEKTPHPNTVLLHGSSDEIVSSAQASIAGARTVIVDGAGHFDWVHPGTQAFSTLLSTLQEMLQP
jgi:pimeloyl-ACP methyl ester carboxylesterase